MDYKHWVAPNLTASGIIGGQMCKEILYGGMDFGKNFDKYPIIKKLETPGGISNGFFG
jgi:hypothetical protein